MSSARKQIKLLLGFAVLLTVIGLSLFFGVKLLSHDEVSSTSQVQKMVEWQTEEYEEFDLSWEEIDELIENDLSQITLSEAEVLLLEHSKSLTTSEQVKQFFRQIVFVACDVEGELNEGTGVLVQGNDENLDEWRVYTNAHITGLNPAEIRICMVSVPLTAGADVSANEEVDTYEAVLVQVASGYPHIDFSELKILDPDDLPDTVLRKCQSDENSLTDKVMVLGYPSGLIVTYGEILNYQEEMLVETSARAYPGHSGGLGFNLTKDCMIGIVAWSYEDTYSALIQTWEMLGI